MVASASTLPAHSSTLAPRSWPVCEWHDLGKAVNSLGSNLFSAPEAGAPVDRGPPHSRPAGSGWPVQQGGPAAAGGLPAADEHSPGSCHAAASLQRHTWWLRRRLTTENDRPVILATRNGAAAPQRQCDSQGDSRPAGMLALQWQTDHEIQNVASNHLSCVPGTHQPGLLRASGSYT